MKSRRSSRKSSGELPFVDPLFAVSLSPTQSHDEGGGGSGGRGRSRARAEQKTLQLCRQVQRALSMSLAGECGDDVLRMLYVDAVVPTPDASRMLVRVIVPVGVESPIHDVLERLDRVKGLLRASVAQAITRKRTPELTFMPILEAPGEVTP